MKQKNSNGITLVALIITIIILLILAGISIASLTQSGLFERAQEAKQKTENAQLEENATLGEYEQWISNYIGEQTPGGDQPEKVEITNVDTSKTNPEAAMPTGATLIEGDATKGIVIKDSNKNEWTWVEVPKIEVFKTAENNKDYDKIKADLIEYAKDYRESYTDTWYNGCGVANSETYTQMYNKMLSSVYTNGGFWISRYEIGDFSATEENYKTRTSNSGASGTAVSQANMIPYNYVTCSEAQSLASGMSTDENKTSSLLFGIQWDLTCKFLETKGGLSLADIKTDSKNWGNYSNSSITLTRGKYNTTPNSSSNQWLPVTEGTIKSSIMLLTTGASDDTNKMNIYDFAGNEWEWTLEKNSDTSNPCTCIGGDYTVLGSSYPISNRYDGRRLSHSSIFIAFRIALY